MKRSRFTTSLVVGTLLLAGIGVTEPRQPAVSTTQGMPSGAKINWTDGLLVAEGKGTAGTGLTQAQAELRALAAARADAQRVLLGAIKGVQITSETSVKDFELQSDEIKASITGLLQNAIPVKGSEKIDRKQDGSLIARVSYAVPLYGDDSVAAATFPSVQPASTGSTPVTSGSSTITDPPAKTGTGSGQDGGTGSETTPPATATPGEGGTTGGTTTTPTESGTDSKFTGFVLDIRNKGYQPCLVPRIKPTTGEEQWATGYVDDPQAKKIGVAAFVRRIEDAKLLKIRGAPSQLTIKGIRATGPSKCDVEVSVSDADKIRKLDTSKGLLGKFKVTFVF